MTKAIKNVDDLKIAYVMSSLAMMVLLIFQAYELLTHGVISFMLLAATVVLALGLQRLEKYIKT